jgi:hypothetical protein
LFAIPKHNKIVRQYAPLPQRLAKPAVNGHRGNANSIDKRTGIKNECVHLFVIIFLYFQKNNNKETAKELDAFEKTKTGVFLEENRNYKE